MSAFLESLGIGAFEAATNLFGQNRTFRNNERLMDKKFRQDREMFDYYNAYNTPRNQVQRLKDAGLNPALMYGKGTTGNADKLPEMEAIPTQFSGELRTQCSWSTGIKSK